jgi:seryl-tRNA synthetase
MLQVNYITQNRETVLERLAVKNFSQTQLVDEIIALDDERKKSVLELEQRLNKRNIVSKEIGFY